MKIKGLIIIIFFHFFICNLLSQDIHQNASNSKKRLPDIINSYQPAIVPVTDLEENILYFDRKIHPDNINGVKDNDDIWYSKKNDNGGWTEPKNIGRLLNTKDSDVLFSLTPDGQFALVYGIYQSDGTKHSGFSISRKTDGNFSSPKPVKINNFYNNSKNFYGFLSADRRVLLMSLNREDSYGDLDLYVSYYDEVSDSFSDPKNLGPIINTKMSEASVHLALDGKTLYFASNGHKGYGKLDLFMSRRLDNSWLAWTEPINLGENINSQNDDGNIWLTAFGKTAYYVSYDSIIKREGIYLGEIPDSLRPIPYAIVSGKVLKSSKNENGIAKESIPIALHYEDSQNIDTVWSDAISGTFRFTFRKGILGTAIVEHEKYSASFSLATYNLEFPKWFEYDIVLRKWDEFSSVETDSYSEKSITIVENKNEPLMILFFDLDSDVLTNESQEKIIDFFKNNSSKHKKLKIVGHTDESGSDNYNLSLSKRRAENTSSFIKKSKLTKSKIVTEAKGKKFPKSENHDKNRRVEIFSIK